MTEVLIAAILVPLMLACFWFTWFANPQRYGYGRVRELPAILLILAAGDRAAKTRLRRVMSGRARQDGTP